MSLHFLLFLETHSIQSFMNSLICYYTDTYIPWSNLLTSRFKIIFTSVHQGWEFSNYDNRVWETSVLPELSDRNSWKWRRELSDTYIIWSITGGFSNDISLSSPLGKLGDDWVCRKTGKWRFKKGKNESLYHETAFTSSLMFTRLKVSRFLCVLYGFLLLWRNTIMMNLFERKIFNWKMFIVSEF